MACAKLHASAKQIALKATGLFTTSGAAYYLDHIGYLAGAVAMGGDRGATDWHVRPPHELELVFNRQQAHEVDHEPLPQAGLGVCVDLYRRAVCLRRPHQIIVLVKQDVKGTAG